MTPPLVCPRGPHGSGPDCPLYDYRRSTEFRREVMADVASHCGLRLLVWRDLNRDAVRPSPPPTKPMPVGPARVGAVVDSGVKTLAEAEKQGVEPHA